mgnify:CR=1 FL=1
MATHISLALVFVEGLVSFLSPCVLPIIPIYMGYLAGNSNEKETQIKSIIIYNQLYLWDTFSNFSDECVNKFTTKFFKEHMTLFVRIGGILIVLLGIYQLGFIKINFFTTNFPFFFVKQIIK